MRSADFDEGRFFLTEERAVGLHLREFARALPKKLLTA